MKDSSSGIIVHEETRQLMSERNIGKNNPNYGNHWSEEKKKEMSEIKKEQYKNGEQIAISENGRKGAEVRNKNWEKNPTLKDKMKKRVSE